MYRFFGNAIIAYVFAAVLWCLMERPVMTLSSALRSGKGKKGQQHSRETTTKAHPLNNKAEQEGPNGVQIVSKA